MPKPLAAFYARSMRRGWILFWLIWVAVGLALIAAGAMAALRPIWIPGAALLAVMVLMLVLTLRRLADPRPVIVIGAAGYHDRRLGDPIPWDAITGLRRHQPGNRIFLQIGVADPARHLGNAGILKGPMLRINPQMGFPVLASSLAGLDVPQADLADAAAAWWSAGSRSGVR